MQTTPPTTVDFIRFKAADDVELQGWLTSTDGDSAAIHIHGMSGNGYENYFLDNLRRTYFRRNISFLAIDTRGRGIIGDFRQNDGWLHGGSCFEIFGDSVHDIQGAINYLKTLGKTRFILQGHSLGCTKVVNFVLTQDTIDIQKVVLLAPTDMAGLPNTDPKHQEYLAKAKQLITDGKGQELVDAQCWLDKTPISAQTYPTICEAGSPADIYGDRDGGALLGRVELPTLIAYGTDDIGITSIDGTMDAWLKRVQAFKHAHTRIAVIDGAQHSFRNYEDKLAEVVGTFL